MAFKCHGREPVGIYSRVIILLLANCFEKRFDKTISIPAAEINQLLFDFLNEKLKRSTSSGEKAGGVAFDFGLAAAVEALRGACDRIDEVEKRSSVVVFVPRGFDDFVSGIVAEIFREVNDVMLFVLRAEVNRSRAVEAFHVVD